MAPLLQPRKSHLTVINYSAHDPIPPVRKLQELKMCCPNGVFFDMIDKLDPEDTDSASEDEDQTSLPTPLTSLYDIYQDKHMQEEEIKELFYSNKLWPTSAQIAQLEKVTRDQAVSRLWYEHRKGRITASKFHDVCNRKSSTTSDTLLCSIMGYNQKDLSKVKAVAWGVDNEDNARQLYEKVMRGSHQTFSLRLSGFLVDSSKPFLGASADGIAACSCHGTRTVEIKCPYKHRDSTALDAAANDNSFCIDTSGKLKQSHKYYSQVQLQMHVNKVSSSDFVIFTNKVIHICTVPYNQTFISDRIGICETFFIKHILPELITRSIEAGLASEETQDHSIEDLSCLCSQPKSGRMIACHNPECEIVWFHYKCVYIKRKPKGRWLCPHCKDE